MLAEERKRKIMDMLEQSRIVKVTELSRALDATEATIRRDLEELQKQDKLRRVHGGAVPNNKMSRDFNYSELSVLRIVEKKRIAARALEYIHDSDTILLDSSTTTFELGRLIRESALKDISVITNSFNLTGLFSGSRVRVIHTGGELFSGMNYAAGAIAEQMLSGIRVDKCFLGTNGIDPSYGYSVPNFRDAAIKKAMLRASKQTFILADHSKFGEAYMARFADCNGEIDYLITDYIPDDVDRTELESCASVILTDK